MPFSNYFLQSVLTARFGAVAVTALTEHYIGLSSSLPSQYPGTNDWNVTEPSGGGYVRLEVANDTTTWTPEATQPTNGYVVVNGQIFTFAESTGEWVGGVPLGWGVIFDAATDGNLLAFGELTPAIQVVGAGYQPTIPSGQLTLSMV